MHTYYCRFQSCIGLECIFQTCFKRSRRFAIFQRGIHVVSNNWFLFRDGIFSKFCVCWNNVQARSQDRFWGGGGAGPPKSGLLWTSPPYPPTKTPFLAHFVAKSEPFGRFGGRPPGYGPDIVKIRNLSRVIIVNVRLANERDWGGDLGEVDFGDI